MAKRISKRFPWGILAGISAVLLFYTIVGTMAAFFVLSAIAGATTEGAGLFGTWYQVVLFAADLVLGLLFIGSLIMFILNKIKKNSTAEVA